MKSEELKKAYELVYQDLMNSEIDLFKGVYDAEFGNEKFMFGICTVLEHIAFMVSEKTQDDFSSIFLKNMIESKKSLDKSKNI